MSHPSRDEAPGRRATANTPLFRSSHPCSARECEATVLGRSALIYEARDPERSLGYAFSMLRGAHISAISAGLICTLRLVR
jgi:hypothetical protein